ncbi:TMEM165/GDT1 family protein [Limosilactobacillus reuteri]|nr:TMEM165/GDT1 family protein [Limosilactobacillus reuteri]
MNWWIIFITFLAVNLDFFFILIFLLERYNLRDVIIGYLGALLVLVTISFLLGKTLAIFLPDRCWLLCFLGQWINYTPYSPSLVWYNNY